MSAEVVPVQTKGSDREVAEEIRAELRPVLEAAAAIQQRARARGLDIGWQIVTDQFGRIQVGPISVTKPL
jgi:hypothetical protein